EIMVRRTLCQWMSAVALVLGGAALAADPPPELQAPVVAPYPTYIRQNRWDVWQSYSVDRYGQWRPRVVLAPYGAYYYYNGAPFPWVTNNMREVDPSILGTPYRYGEQPGR